ncbi:MAG TPA: hypothetical protein VK489_13675 [Ferruginibacter sp.]|nr:hypothetical protein [Ferruginibacter sp.]
MLFTSKKISKETEYKSATPMKLNRNSKAGHNNNKIQTINS